MKKLFVLLTLSMFFYLKADAKCQKFVQLKTLHGTVNAIAELTVLKADPWDAATWAGQCGGRVLSPTSYYQHQFFFFTGCELSTINTASCGIIFPSTFIKNPRMTAVTVDFFWTQKCTFLGSVAAVSIRSNVKVTFPSRYC